MDLLVIITVLGIGAAAVLLWPAPAEGTGDTSVTPSLDSIFNMQGATYGVEPVLLKAIAMTESSLNPRAVNPSDPSYGLMGILYPATRFGIEGWPPASAEALYDPAYNVQIGAQVLAWNQRTYGWLRGIATYNRWASRLDPPAGPFGNQAYVRRVLRHYVASGGRNPEAGRVLGEAA